LYSENGSLFEINQLIIFVVPVLLLAPGYSLMAIAGSFLKGFGRTWKGLLFDNGVLVSMLLLIFVVTLHQLGGKLNVSKVVSLYSVAVLFSTAVGGYLLYDVIRLKKRDAVFRANDVLATLRTSSPLLIVSLLTFANANADRFFIGHIIGSSYVGFYDVAVKLSMLVSFLMLTCNAVLAPRFAAFFAVKDLDGLRDLAQKATLILILICWPLAFFVIANVSWILSFWGADFVQAGPALVVLVVGQLLNVAVGPVGCLMAMTGNEKILRNSTFSVFLLNIALNMLLISEYGIVGAALATGLCVGFQNIFLFAIIKKKFGFYMVSAINPFVKRVA
jgi:O-antigen/teichoic acid export membrane protein